MGAEGGSSSASAFCVLRSAFCVPPARAWSRVGATGTPDMTVPTAVGFLPSIAPQLPCRVLAQKNLSSRRMPRPRYRRHFNL